MIQLVLSSPESMPHADRLHFRVQGDVPGPPRSSSEDGTAHPGDASRGTDRTGRPGRAGLPGGGLDRLRGFDGTNPRRHRRPGYVARRVGSAQEVRLLLDTHIWLWSLLDPSRLSKRVLDEIAKPSNEKWLSPIS